MSGGFRLALIWLVGGTIALAAALNWLPAVFFDGDVLPAGHDSFYHARRALDAVSDPSSITQFDRLIHAPEGSWVPWPWGYDYFLAWVGTVATSVNPNVDPLAILVYVPSLWVFVNAALILGIAGTLGLHPGLRLAAVLCFAFSPLTQHVHGLGRIDHHYFEYTFVLLALLAGLRWFRNPDSVGLAIVFGIVLGTASAFHNGLFVLQLPLLAGITIMWLKKVRVSNRSVAHVAAALFGSTLVAAVPSIPFREGMFAYHLLSWFHVYIAFCTAACLLLTTRLQPGRAGVAVLSVAAAGMLIPILIELRSGLGFIATEISELKGMPETRSVFGGTGAASFSPWQAWREYSGLVFTLPLVMMVSAWLTVRTYCPDRIYFYVFTLFGGAMLLAQYRFHTFGSFALYLPMLLWWQRTLNTKPGIGSWSVLAVVLIAAYIPAFGKLRVVPVPGFSYDYVATRSVYPPLTRACETQPGVVLAEHNYGHYIRFHSDCAVIANNLILTQQSREKIRQTQELFALQPADLRDRAPWIGYVLATRLDNVFDESISRAEARDMNPGLRRALLFEPPPYPEGYRLLHQVVIDRGDGEPAVVARLFQITR